MIGTTQTLSALGLAQQQAQYNQNSSLGSGGIGSSSGLNVIQSTTPPQPLSLGGTGYGSIGYVNTNPWTYQYNYVSPNTVSLKRVSNGFIVSKGSDEYVAKTFEDAFDLMADLLK